MSVQGDCMLLVIIMNYWPNMQPILGNAGVVCQELQRGHLGQAQGGWDQVLHPEHGTYWGDLHSSGLLRPTGSPYT